MKKIFIIALAVLMIGVLLAGCGNKNTATPDSAATESTVSPTEKETTKVIETTSDGGTIEQDKEGNVIEKDKNGEIVSVKDKDGKVIQITEYITTHTYVIDGSSDSGSDDSGSASGGSSSGSDKQDQPEKKDEPEKKDSPAAAEDSPIEQDEYELPII